MPIRSQHITHTKRTTFVRETLLQRPELRPRYIRTSAQCLLRGSELGSYLRKNWRLFSNHLTRVKGGEYGKANVHAMAVQQLPSLSSSADSVLRFLRLPPMREGAQAGRIRVCVQRNECSGRRFPERRLTLRRSRQAASIVARG